jgi:tetratricopeptide (TPR) repeat protein/tRNA A-37 threonylcarbamoyl transferase component Bud32
MSPPAADRNLLFGVLAAQLSFVSGEALLAAMSAWSHARHKPLGDILREQGQLSDEQLRGLDQLIELHLRAHGGDPQRSLRALSTVTGASRLFEDVDDPNVRDSLASLSTVSKGEPVADGRPFRPRADGRYRLLRPHARGGLGEVFVAEDTELHREVAVKEIQAHRADDPASRARFVHEAEVTGGLEHPGIVPVYGLGTRPDGRPYYAMRFIRGVTLKASVEHFHAADRAPGRNPAERNLAFRQLLRRFCDVCNAVAYAHSRGVLHRDLKPANVMLGEFGETLVVDWGLAKTGAGSSPADADEPTTDQLLSPASADRLVTQAGSAMGTPGYMSPEQAAGRHAELGPATDVYGLGATLYLILTGRKPFDGDDAHELMERVKRGEFVAPRAANPAVPAALDAVCRKAMALRPEDRYAAALDLAADVEHWLADEPVGARRDPPLARLGRWARRHRTGVAAAAVLLVTATAALGVSTALVWREKERTKEQERRAERSYVSMRDLSGDVLNLMETAEAELVNSPGLMAARDELVGKAARAFRIQLEQQPDDAELRRRAAQVFRYAANVRRLANDLDGAETLYLDSLRLYRGLAKENSDVAASRQKLCEAARDYGTFQALTGRLGDASETFREAAALAEGLVAQDDLPTHRRSLAISLAFLAGNEDARGRSDEAKQLAGRAAALYRGLLAGPAPQPYDSLLLASVLNRAAIVERDAGRPDSARPLHAEACKIMQGVVDRRPAGVGLTDAVHHMALFRLSQARTWALDPKRRANAETNLAATAKQWEGLAGSHPAVPMYRAALGEAYLALGELRAMETSRVAEARASFENARRLFADLARDHPRLPGPYEGLGRACAGLGRLAKARAEAADWFDKAAAALGEAAGMSPEDVRIRVERDGVAVDQRKLAPS